MLFLEKILAEVKEIVASGKFVGPDMPFNDERDAVLEEITDPGLKACYTLFVRYKMAVDKAESAFVRSMVRVYKRNDLKGNFQKAEIAVGTALANAEHAQLIFDIELIQAYPHLIDKVRLGFRAGWLLVERKISGSNTASQEIDHRFQDVRRRAESCNDPECPVHGAKARAARDGNAGSPKDGVPEGDVLQQPKRMRHNMRAFKIRNGPL